MASGNTVWGIDIGQCALKAIKMRVVEDGKVEALAFDVIEHAKILSQPDADRDELIGSALEKFASRNDWQGDQFLVGVPGQQTFARFCKMPPIDLKKDAKKIPELVRYEASQQIPFDMDDVVWDYQVFTSEDTPDIEVGIFAIRKDLIRKHLDYFGEVGIAPMGVQTIPAALYNFCQFDGQRVGEGAATVIIDVGAQNTDLIIVEPNAAWTRNIPLGGNSFTEALVRAFKLSFAKAESLKRSAAASKYARQIFQAMRPVFADLVAEIQRSIGFYSSTHRDVELKKVLALGNAFRLPGLQKYLENNLTIAGGVTKLEKFGNLLPSATTNAPQFTENILSFAAAYGLALQGLGMGKIEATLLPTELARIATWRKKRPYFVATAASLLLGAAVPYIANGLDIQTLKSERGRQMSKDAQKIVRDAEKFASDYAAVAKNTDDNEADIKKLFKLQEQKLVLPRLLTLANAAMPPIDPRLAQCTSAEDFKKLIESSEEGEFDRTNRGQFIIDSLMVQYVEDVTSATTASGAMESTSPTPTGPTPGGRPSGTTYRPPGGMMFRPGGPSGFSGPPGMMGGPGPSAPAAAGGGGGGETPENAGFIVRLEGRLMYGRIPSKAQEWMQNYQERLRELGQQPDLGFHIPEDDAKDRQARAIGVPYITRFHQVETGGGLGRPLFPAPGGAVAESGTGAVQFPDPVTGEETMNDWRVQFAFKVKLGDLPEKEPVENQ